MDRLGGDQPGRAGGVCGVYLVFGKGWAVGAEFGGGDGLADQVVPCVQKLHSLCAQLAGFFLIVHEADEEVAGLGNLSGLPAEVPAVVEDRDVDIDAVELPAGSLGCENVLNAEIGFFVGTGG